MNNIKRKEDKTYKKPYTTNNGGHWSILTYLLLDRRIVIPPDRIPGDFSKKMFSKNIWRPL